MILGAGCWMIVAGCWMLDFGLLTLKVDELVKSQKFNFGSL
jgi:hypothetical protein